MTVARTQPASHYLPDRGDFLRELRFLRTQWVMLAHDGALPEPGDNFALDILGCPILLRRERDGSLTAFLNACPHRGGPLAWPGQSNTRLLQCRYHGWTFRGDGALIEPVGFGRERREIHCTARTPPSAADRMPGRTYSGLSESRSRQRTARAAGRNDSPPGRGEAAWDRNIPGRV